MRKSMPVAGTDGAFSMRYREVVVAVLEVVPPVDQLPYCTAQKRDGNLCDFHARYMRNENKPVCGVHLFSRTEIFLED